MSRRRQQQQPVLGLSISGTAAPQAARSASSSSSSPTSTTSSGSSRRTAAAGGKQRGASGPAALRRPGQGSATATTKKSSTVAADKNQQSGGTSSRTNNTASKPGAEGKTNKGVVAKDADASAEAKTESQAAEDAVVENSTTAHNSDGAEEASPTQGSVTLRYNHYKHEFDVTCPPGTISIADIDDRFSFSYGFKGNYKILLQGPGQDGPLLERDDEHIKGVVLNAGEYFCVVEEDPEELKKERKSYKAQGSDAVSKARVFEDEGGSSLGEDRASCSCIEGNPCAVQYNCKDWANRFEVAKRNGWKGFS